jgi:hypothetical protein
VTERWLAWLRRHIEPEDIALGFVLVLTPLIGGSSDLGARLLSGADDPTLGLVALVSCVGAIAAIATRVPGESVLDQDHRWGILGPFLGAVSLLGSSSLGLLGFPNNDLFIGPAFVITTGAVLLGNRLPVVSRQVRRVMVAPFVLFSGAVLQSLVVSIGGALAGQVDVSGIFGQPKGPVLLFDIVLIALFVSWIFYAMLVYAPRELASPGASVRSWVIRFVLFFVTLVIGVVIGNMRAVTIV